MSKISGPASARVGTERHAADGVIRRHWIAQLVVAAGDDSDTLLTCYYALIVETALGERPTVHLSTTGRDALVRDRGAWQVRERWITHDDMTDG